MIKRGQNRYAAKFLPGVNIYLVGFMGTGKSTVGRALAYRLGYEFFDSDSEIERRAGMPVSKIFESEGEATFRRYEREFVEKGHPLGRCVIACGGGLVMEPGMIELLKGKGVVICLYASSETILQRTHGNKSRPLLNVADPEKRIRELLAVREPFYRRAGTLVLTDNRGLTDIVEHLKRVYMREADSFIREQREKQQRKGPTQPN